MSLGGFSPSPYVRQGGRSPVVGPPSQGVLHEAPTLPPLKIPRGTGGHLQRQRLDDPLVGAGMGNAPNANTSNMSHAMQSMRTYHSTGRRSSFSTLFSVRTSDTGPYHCKGLLKMQKMTHVVDMSYLELETFLAIKEAEPRSGKRHVPKSIRLRVKAEKELEEAIARGEYSSNPNAAQEFYSRNGIDAGMIVVRAKGEQYAFREQREINEAQQQLNDEMKNVVVSSDPENTAEVQVEEVEKPVDEEDTYLCTLLNLANNSIPAIEGKKGDQHVFPILKALLFQPGTNLVTIDLSSNHISTLPVDFSELSYLSTLYLHDNKISKMDEVEKLSHVSSLRRVTLYCNPIQDRVKRYRFEVLYRLLQLLALDGNAVTPAERENLVVFEDMFVDKKKKKRNGVKLDHLRTLLKRP